MARWTPRDVIALVMIIGAFGLRALGINHVTEWVIVGVGGAYLGIGAVRQGVSYIRTSHPRTRREQERVQ